MSRLLLIVTLAAAAAPAGLVAQSSQFGIQGLGFPSRGLSVRSMGAGGAFGFFDPASSLNPASLNEAGVLTASFTLLQNYRSSTNPGGTASGRDTRFPQMLVGGRIRGLPLAVGASFSSYTDRSFSLATEDTVILRGEPIGVTDTLGSTGGMSDLRLAGSYYLSGWVFGAGLHVITGSNRVRLQRAFGDSSYAPIQQRAEISYAGAGVSVGVTRPLGPRLLISAMARADGSASVDRDSARVAEVDLPLALGGAIRWRPSARLDVAVHALTRRWSSADEDLRALGGTGARNTVELAAGIELTRNPRRPQQKPIRVGARFATLPFPVENGAQAREFGVSVGTGLRFAQDRMGIDHAGIDFSLERVWRGAAGGYREGAWLIGVGVMVRP